jgi:hypothetical protein
MVVRLSRTNSAFSTTPHTKKTSLKRCISIITSSLTIMERSCSKTVVSFADARAETAMMALRTAGTSQIITTT